MASERLTRRTISPCTSAVLGLSQGLLMQEDHL